MGTQRATTAEFIEKAEEVHGDRYDYSLAEYLGSKLKVDIVCKTHGVFGQTPASHYRGSGCPTCGSIEQSKSMSADANQFVEKARSRHGELYDYSLVEYSTNKAKVKIICKEHGMFLQSPANHCRGAGCPHHSRNGSKSNTQKFIEKAKNVHGEKYDYRLVEYSTSKANVEIICRIHGEFLQSPASHHKGYGCPTCGNQKCDTQGFIKKAKRVHGGKYDYSSTEYIGNHSKVKIICRIHGEFLQSPGSHLMGRGCSGCSLVSSRGSSSPHWNPNLTAEERVKGRKSLGRELKGWKQSVFDRDQYTCQKCLQLRGKIQAHHILPYALFPEVRTDISNGITLCKSCHAKYHSAYGIKKECSHKTMDLYISAMA